MAYSRFFIFATIGFLLASAMPAEAQGVGIQAFSDPMAFFQGIATWGLRAGQYIGALAAMWKGIDVWSGTHNLWHAATGVLGGAAIFFGVPAAFGVSVL
jgi:hypothetical protein